MTRIDSPASFGAPASSNSASPQSAGSSQDAPHQDTAALQNTVPQDTASPHSATAPTSRAVADRASAPVDFTATDTVFQLLDPSGQLRDPRENPDAPELHRQLAEIANDLEPQTLRAFLRDMTIMRRFDNEATSLQRQGELGLWAPALGQEGGQVGSAHALQKQDQIFPSYREHPIAWVRGVDVVELLKLFRGTQHGGWDPTAEHNFHIYTLVIGSHTLHATGYAMGLQRDGLVGTGDRDTDAATVVYFGDGASSQGDVAEAFGFASVNKAPVVFFCQNNQWAISVPSSSQTTVPISRRALGYGMPTIRIDGNDALAGWAATRWASDYAAAGNGPVLIEAMTYRMGAHTTSDDPTRYRTEEEEETWRQRDPITRLQTFLQSRGDISEADLAAWEAQADELAERVRTEVRAMTAPPADSFFENVYTEPHLQVSAERDWFSKYHASFVEEDAQ